MSKSILLFLPITAALILQALMLGLAAQISGQPVQTIVTPLSVTVAALMLISGLLPALVRPQPSHTLIACFSICFAFLLVVPFEGSQLPALEPGRTTLEFLTPYLLLRMVNAAVLLPMAVHVSARFPRPAPIPQWTISGGYVFSAALVGAFLLSSLPWQRFLSVILLFLWFTLVIAIFIRNLLAIARHPSLADPREAQQARIVLVSLLIAEIPLWLRPLTLAFGLNLIPYDLLLVLQLVIPAGIAYAVLRHDLFGIDRVLRRTLAYGAVSLALLILYLALTGALTGLFARTTAATRPLAPLISLLIAALLFEPARRLTQKSLDRLLYPDRLKFQSAVAAVQASLARANRREQIVRLLDEEFPARIGAEWAALKLFPEPDVPPPHVSAPAWNTRLMAGSVSFGGYWLGPRRAGPVYDSDERDRLGALTQQAALALAYASAYESLYELNRNLEARVQEQTAQALEDQQSIAAYRERQRIARDLHDSVTQSLFGMHLMARGLNAALPPSLPEIKREMAALEAHAQSVLHEMRLLLDQLRNPSGEEPVELVEAIRGLCEALARRSGPEGGPLLTVALESPASVTVPSALGAEALWVVREALQNIVRHSGCRTANITVKTDSSLQVTVQDHGQGFDAQSLPAGHYGLRGMRERVLALGGGFEIESEPGRGTMLTISFPLSKPGTINR